MSFLSSVKVGSLWESKETGTCVCVVSVSRTGHQYDRYFEIEVLGDKGEISSHPDYAFVQDFNQVSTKDD